ncbi:MAG: hypothetical protein IPK19_24785 [Chloroflexi bacterium]|nr:hypothetical protein [Chloroflexota bacterium]
MSLYQYPLNLRFKLIALAPRITVTDASGRQVAYVHQKLWNLKEDVRIYTDEQKSREVFRINADRIIDVRAKYHFTDSATGQPLGYVQPRALMTIWRATYHIYDANGTVTHHIREDNPWVKVLDTLFQEIPFVGMFAGYLLHPSFTVYRGSEPEDLSMPVLNLKKEPAFFEGVFTLDRLGEMSPQDEQRALLATMLMIQFMRRRG